MDKKGKQPPRLAWLLLRFLLKDQDRHAILGDFEEQYHAIFQSKGKMFAVLWYWGNLIKSSPSVIYLKFYWSSTMLMNYLKIAIRNMKRHKSYTLINIIGLAIGLACTFVILLWVLDETSYDQSHKNKKIFIKWFVIGKREESPLLYLAFYPRQSKGKFHKSFCPPV